jgi:hypothetical protein
MSSTSRLVGATSGIVHPADSNGALLICFDRSGGRLPHSRVQRWSYPNRLNRYAELATGAKDWTWVPLVLPDDGPQEGHMVGALPS